MSTEPDCSRRGPCSPTSPAPVSPKGDAAGAVDAATDAVTVAARQQANVVECLALLTRAQILRATDGHVIDIAADLDAALALVSETGALTYEPFIREQFARLRDDPAEMEQALRLYAAIGATGHAGGSAPNWMRKHNKAGSAHLLRGSVAMWPMKNDG